MEFEEVTDLPKYYSRAFFAVVGLILFILFVFDVFVLENGRAAREITSDLIGHIIGGILAAILTVAFLRFFVPRSLKSNSVNQIAATEITKEFERLLSTATRWRFKGNLGRYLRGKVLPTLAAKQQIDVDVSIIDPRNSTLCAKHAASRSQIDGIDKGRAYDAKVVALEAVTTIMHCAWHIQNSGMSIDLHLTSAYDPVRIDAGDSEMIVTVEDRRSPAFKFSSGNFMYTYLMAHMRSIRDQAEKINLGGFKRSANFQQVTGEDIEEFMEKIGMSDLCKSLGADRILADCRANYNPYRS